MKTCVAHTTGLCDRELSSEVLRCNLISDGFSVFILCDFFIVGIYLWLFITS